MRRPTATLDNTDVWYPVFLGSGFAAAACRSVQRPAARMTKFIKGKRMRTRDTCNSLTQN